MAALFVFIGGLNVMRRGLTGLMDSRLPGLLTRLVRTPTRGILTGLSVTALLQTSGAVTVATIGLVASGSMAFRDAVGIVLGANVGSTVTPQLLVWDLTGAAVVLLLAGSAAWLFSHRPQLRSSGQALAGFACIVIALETLERALRPLANEPWFQAGLAHMANSPLSALVAGCLASALVQSSTVTTVMAMALAEEHLLSLPAGVGVVLGANVGTCLTSVIASIGQIRPAQQVALAHVLLNVGGALVFLPWVEPYCNLMLALSDDPSQQLANAHTIFNVLCTLAVWPWAGAYARVIESLLPAQHDP
ncbi:MAG: Na/Pi symporter [Alicyclobacillus sp.]|nr:Na/Pi symporter [Alicyclobacillus sp.]